MEIPAILYGTYADVKTRCKKLLVTYVKHGGSLIELIEAQGLLSTSEHPGDIALYGPGPPVSGTVNFQCFAPLRVLDDHMPPSLQAATRHAHSRALEVLLQRPWGVLCLLDGNNMTSWLTRETVDYCRSHVRAVLACWDDLTAEGRRYALGSIQGWTVWQAGSPIGKALFFLGVPQDVLFRFRDGIPDDDLAAFIVAYADPALAGDVLDVAREQLGRPRPAPAPTPPPAPLPSQPPVAVPSRRATPAMVAAMLANDAVTVQRLIEAGEPAGAMVMELMTSPVFWAAEHGHTSLLRCVLECEPATDAPDIEGSTPLMLAARGGHLETVKLLLDRGADPNAVTRSGWDALAYARASGHHEVLELLEKVYSPEALEQNHENSE